MIFFLNWIVHVLYILRMLILCQICDLYLCSLYNDFWWTNVLSFIVVWTFFVLSKKLFPTLRPLKYSYFLKGEVLPLTFRYIIYWELVFVYGMRYKSNFIYFHKGKKMSHFIHWFVISVSTTWQHICLT